MPGVAPLNRYRGTYYGSLCICGGRAVVRTAQHMATLPSLLYNPDARFFQWLVAAEDEDGGPGGLYLSPPPS